MRKIQGMRAFYCKILLTRIKGAVELKSRWENEKNLKLKLHKITTVR